MAYLRPGISVREKMEPSTVCRQIESHFFLQNSVQPDGLALLAIRSNKRRKSRERAHLANAGEFNRRYLSCQISAILYANRGDRRKSQSLHRAHLVIFADHGDRRIKSAKCVTGLRTLGNQI